MLRWVAGLCIMGAVGAAVVGEWGAVVYGAAVAGGVVMVEVVVSIGRIDTRQRSCLMNPRLIKWLLRPQRLP